MGEYRELTVVIDNDSSNECLYIDGERWEEQGETTVYAIDLATAANGHLVYLTHESVEWDTDMAWPEKLSDIPR